MIDNMIDNMPTSDNKLPFSIPQSLSTDDLLHYLYEAKLTKEQREYIINDVLADVDDKESTFFEKDTVTPAFIKTFEQLKSLGLGIRDVSAIMGISVKKMQGYLNGKNISPELHKQLLKAELRGDAELKQLCIGTIKSAVVEGNWKAALALLEKAFPDEYSKKVEVSANTNLVLGVNECEKKASDAMQALRILRESRKTDLGKDLAEKMND